MLGHGGTPPPHEEHGDGFQAEAEAGEGRGGAGEDRGDACDNRVCYSYFICVPSVYAATAVPPLRMRSMAMG